MKHNVSFILSDEPIVTMDSIQKAYSWSNHDPYFSHLPHSQAFRLAAPSPGPQRGPRRGVGLIAWNT